MLEKLLPYLMRHVADWQQYHLVEPKRESAPICTCLETAIQQYLRSSEKHPLFDEPVVIWWSDADHALLIPCRIQTTGRHLSEDSKAFRLVRMKPPAQALEQAASL